jgi:hypothetical protein
MVYGREDRSHLTTRSLKLYSRLLHTLRISGPANRRVAKYATEDGVFLTYCGRKVHVDTGNDTDVPLAH